MARVPATFVVRSVSVVVAVTFLLTCLRMAAPQARGPGDGLDGGWPGAPQRRESRIQQFESKVADIERRVQAAQERLSSLRTRHALYAKSPGAAEAPGDQPTGPAVPAVRGQRSSLPKAPSDLVDLRALVAELDDAALSSSSIATEDTRVVIVMQVHNRARYLREALIAMWAVQGIQQALLVLSHDVYSDEMNDVVSQYATFCPTVQIFYPMALQLYPNEFPGTDPNDCPRDFHKDESPTVRCNNEDHPDLYGHYREAQYTATKHHWWWKANVVFDRLAATRQFSGPFLFVEEDHYLMPDALKTLAALGHIRDTSFPDVPVVAIGGYAVPRMSSRVDANVGPWLSSKHNIALAFDRSFWHRIRACAQAFCSYDDYNWDWTLQHLGTSGCIDNIRVIAAQLSRVRHLGKCGMHQKPSDPACDPEADVRALRNEWAANQADLMAVDSFKIHVSHERQRAARVNGGWADTRDIQLCMEHVTNGAR